MSKGSRGGEKTIAEKKILWIIIIIIIWLMTSCSFFEQPGGDGKGWKLQKKNKTVVRHFPSQEMSVVLQRFSRRKTTHYLRVRQAATTTTSDEDLQETSRR